MKRLFSPLGLTLLLAATLLLAVCCGGLAVYSPGQVAGALARGLKAGLAEILELSEAGAQLTQDDAVIFYMRFPRAIAAALAGAALGLSGLLMQGLFRNPLASPGILGATSGGVFGAVGALALGLQAFWLRSTAVFSFAGSFVAVTLVYLLATAGRSSVRATHLILSGVAVNAIFAAGTTLLLTLSSPSSVEHFDLTRKIVFWLSGGFQNRNWGDTGLLTVCLLPCVAGALFVGRDLNLLSSGEESAQSLGVELRRLKLWVILLASLAAGAAVAVGGMIGFVGLVAPHIVRLVTGPDHRRLAVTAPLFGASFLALADLVAIKIVPPHELQVGVLTSLLGGPFFIYLLVRDRRRIT